MLNKLDHNVLGQYAQVASHGDLCLIVMKIVVFDIEDLMFARELFHRYPMLKPFLSVGTPQGQPYNATRLEISRRLCWLYEESLKYPDLANVTILPQLHVLAWGSKKGV
jgi:7-carboxy-7-deazaguanine synthase